MWHASIAGPFPARARKPRLVRALLGLGGQAIGFEERSIATHLRKLLTPEELAAAGITGARDLRGTEEATERLAAMREHLEAAGDAVYRNATREIIMPHPELF